MHSSLFNGDNDGDDDWDVNLELWKDVYKPVI
jgi:hypothetical protein